MKAILLILLTTIASLAQKAPAPLAFEVASIKPSPPLNMQAIAAGQLPRIGMNVQGTRVNIGFMSLADLIPMAFKVKPYQVTGPDWMKSERFDISAVMPEGTNKDQVPEMLQALLVERFQLKVHHEMRDAPIYALVVAKGGHKLKESPADPETAATEPVPGEPPAAGNRLPEIKIERGGGGATVNAGQRGTARMSMTPEGNMRMEMSKVTMEAFVQMLNPMVDHPVFDMTELKGNYQVAFELSRDSMMNMARVQGLNLPIPVGRGAAPGTVEASDPSSSAIFTSIQQLGLRLEPRKMPLDHIVVEHLEKSPTEN